MENTGTSSILSFCALSIACERLSLSMIGAVGAKWSPRTDLARSPRGISSEDCAIAPPGTNAVSATNTSQSFAVFIKSVIAETMLGSRIPDKNCNQESSTEEQAGANGGRSTSGRMVLGGCEWARGTKSTQRASARPFSQYRLQQAR